MAKGGLSEEGSCELRPEGSQEWEERSARSEASRWGQTWLPPVWLTWGAPMGRSEDLWSARDHGEGIGLVQGAAENYWRACGPRTRDCAFQPLDSSLCLGHSSDLEPAVSAG